MTENFLNLIEIPKFFIENKNLEKALSYLPSDFVVFDRSVEKGEFPIKVNSIWPEGRFFIWSVPGVNLSIENSKYQVKEINLPKGYRLGFLDYVHLPPAFTEIDIPEYCKGDKSKPQWLTDERMNLESLKFGHGFNIKFVYGEFGYILDLYEKGNYKVGNLEISR